MLHRLIATVAVLLLLLPTVALADPPDRIDETEYQEDVAGQLAPYLGEESKENDGVDSWTIEFGAGK